MRPKARWLAQHGGPPGWLEESDPAGCDFVRDGRSVPPALKVPHHLHRSVLNVYKTPSKATSRNESLAWYSIDPCLVSDTTREGHRERGNRKKMWRIDIGSDKKIRIEFSI